MMAISLISGKEMNCTCLWYLWNVVYITTHRVFSGYYVIVCPTFSILDTWHRVGLQSISNSGWLNVKDFECQSTYNIFRQNCLIKTTNNALGMLRKSSRSCYFITCPKLTSCAICISDACVWGSDNTFFHKVSFGITHLIWVQKK